MTQTQHSSGIAPLLAANALVAGGAMLAIAQIIFGELTPILPEHAALAIWADFNQSQLAWVARLLTLSAIILAPAFYLLIQSFKRHCHDLTRLLWLGIAPVSIIAILVASLFAGKLAFSPYDIGLSAEAAELSVSLIIICFHIMSMALGIGLILIGLAYRNQVRTPYAEFSVVAGIGQLVGAYPWLLPDWSVLVTSVLLFAWAATTQRSLWAVDISRFLGVPQPAAQADATEADTEQEPKEGDPGPKRPTTIST
ncbi:MAG: hypothetical protein Q4B17_04550 [Lautropia sp.]|nr:hypothetical protein [Lautropia sp.]